MATLVTEAFGCIAALVVFGPRELCAPSPVTDGHRAVTPPADGAGPFAPLERR